MLSGNDRALILKRVPCLGIWFSVTLLTCALLDMLQVGWTSAGRSTRFAPLHRICGRNGVGGGLTLGSGHRGGPVQCRTQTQATVTWSDRSWPAAWVWVERAPCGPLQARRVWSWGACLPKFPRPAASVPPPEPLSVLKQID